MRKCWHSRLEQLAQSHISGRASIKTPAFSLLGLCSPREMWTTHLFRLSADSLKLLSSSLGKCKRELVKKDPLSSLCHFWCLSPFHSNSSWWQKKKKKVRKLFIFVNPRTKENVLSLCLVQRILIYTLIYTQKKRLPVPSLLLGNGGNCLKGVSCGNFCGIDVQSHKTKTHNFSVFPLSASVHKSF